MEVAVKFFPGNIFSPPGFIGKPTIELLEEYYPEEGLEPHFWSLLGKARFFDQVDGGFFFREWLSRHFRFPPP